MKIDDYKRTKRFEKGEMIISRGDRTEELGIVEEGNVNIESTNLWGDKTIINNIGKGAMFLEAYALSGRVLMVDVVAAEDSLITLINVKRMLSPSNANEDWYLEVLNSLLKVSSEKNLTLSSKLLCLSAKTIRERVMNYLTEEMLKTGSREIVIPFDRQGMADYLNVERTALSKELSKMREDGLIVYRKNTFVFTQYGQKALEWNQEQGRRRLI